MHTILIKWDVGWCDAMFMQRDKVRRYGTYMQRSCKRTRAKFLWLSLTFLSRDGNGICGTFQLDSLCICLVISKLKWSSYPIVIYVIQNFF